MKTVKIDLTNIQTVRALHIYLQYKLDLPAYYGRNLDALYDLLTTESERTHMVIAGEPCGEVTAFLPRLLDELEEAAEENEKITFERA